VRKDPVASSCLAWGGVDAVSSSGCRTSGYVRATAVGATLLEFLDHLSKGRVEEEAE